MKRDKPTHSTLLQTFRVGTDKKDNINRVFNWYFGTV